MSIPKVDQYILNFEKMGFGMFVHFGLYSQIGRGEWNAQREGTDETSYRRLAGTFCPGSMTEIVVTAKAAGAKYITFTAKHHDGFALFDTRGLSHFDSIHSAAGRDIVREFVDVCRKHGIVPFLYYATYEWWNTDFQNDFDAYLEYLRKSVEILCTQYGKIGGFWFDGNWSRKDVNWHEGELYATIRKYQPRAIIINNTGLSAQGITGHSEIDCVTFERGRPVPLDREGAEKYITGEMCESVNAHWGNAKDFNFKSPKKLIEELCECRKVGANFLLNIGPDKNAAVPAMPKAIMLTIGEWMKMFGEAVYNGKPLWFNDKTRNFALESEEYVYLFRFDLCRRGSADVTYIEGTEGEFVFENFQRKVKDIQWMDNGEKLEYSYDGNNLKVHFTGFEYGIDYCVRVARAIKVE